MLRDFAVERMLCFLVGFLLVTSVRATVLTDNFLLVADSLGIWQMPLDGSSATSLPIDTKINAVAMDYDPVAQTVFWMDAINDAVNSAPIAEGKMKMTVLVQLNFVSSVEGLAVDPSARLLFYTDSTRHTISVNTYYGQSEKTIVVNTRKPRSIKIDLTRRQLYWCDWEMEAIYTSAYDGSGLVALVSLPGTWLYGIALDLVNDNIYWTDALSGNLYTANLDSSALIISNIGSITTFNFYGLATDGVNIYFTDVTRGLVDAVPISGAKDNVFSSHTFSQIAGILLYSSDSDNTVASVDCQNNFEQCADLCLPLQSGPECACRDYTTVFNVTQCVSEFNHIAPFLLWVELDDGVSYLHGISGEPGDFLTHTPIVDWLIADKTSLWTSAVADYSGRNLYLVDSFYRSIVQMSLRNDPSPRTIVDSLSSNIGKIAFDWQSGCIYWTDSLFNKIVMTPVSQSDFIKTVIILELDQPIGLALYPPNGTIFWSSTGTVDKIESMTMSGDYRTVLVAGTFNGGHPVSLTVDYTNFLLYWCTQDHVEAMNFDGSNRTAVFTIPGRNFFELTYYNNYIFILDDGDPGSALLWIVNVTLPGLPIVSKLQLAASPQCLSVFSPHRTPDTSIACPHCEQMCISSPHGSAQCDCQDGWFLNTDGLTCTRYDAVPPGSLFVYTLSDSVCLLPIAAIVDSLFFSTINCVKYRRNGVTSTIDINYYNGALYVVVQYPVTPVPLPVIARLYLRQQYATNPVVYGADASGIAVNWISSNLYLTYNHRGTIMVARTDGRFEKTLISNLNQPKGIAIEITHRKLYWSEQGIGQIRMSDLDGRNIQKFVGSPHVTYPGNLQIDYNEWRLYWIESAGIIHSIGFNAQDHRQFAPTVHKSVTIINDFTIYQNYLVLATQTSDVTVGAALYFVDKHTGLPLRGGISHPSYSQIVSVVSYAPDNEPLDTGDPSFSCGFENGGCEQLCFGSMQSRSCGCTDGMVLSSDGYSCVPGGSVLHDKFFLLTDNYRHRILQADNLMNNITTLFSPGLDFPLAVAYDFSETRVYWSDTVTGVIKSALIDGTSTNVVFGPRTGSVFTALSFDSRSKLLYYVDDGLNIAGVIAVKGGHHKILATFANDTSLGGLALNVFTNTLFYSIVGLNQSIMKVNMDGSNAAAFVSTDMVSPRGLAVDANEKRLYWCDSAKQTIESVKLDGTDRRVDHFINTLSTLSQPYSVASVGKYLFYSDWSGYLPGIQRHAKDNSGDSSLGDDIIVGLKTLAYFDSSLAAGTSSICSTNNGGCSHMCIPVPSGRVCACPDDSLGHSVQPTDGFNCPGSLTCEENIANGHTVSCNRTVGSVCSFSCNSGFHPTTTASLQCLPGLVWSTAVDDLCTVTTCGIVTAPPNADLSPSCSMPATIGSHCIATCDLGYQQSGGDTQRDCLANGLWSGSPIECSLYCQPLPQPDNTVNVSSVCNTQPQVVGTTCQYYCAVGYSSDQGTPARTCRADRRWSGANITCVQNDDSSDSPYEGYDGFYIAGIVISVIILTIVLAIIMAASVHVYKRFLAKRRQQQGFQYNTMSDSVFPSNIRDPALYAPDADTAAVAASIESPYTGAYASFSNDTHATPAAAMQEKPTSNGASASSNGFTSLAIDSQPATYTHGPPAYNEAAATAAASTYQNTNYGGGDYASIEETSGVPLDGIVVTTDGTHGANGSSSPSFSQWEKFDNDDDKNSSFA